MSDIIQVLPDSVANQIAAGEVIQRPASVIKELVENAVDAGAQTIHVLVVDAGRTSIQVVDDGKGMSETDARMAFERHATSKIRHADDLFALHTMGFRGEALASVAAVAQVELRTRRPEDEVGTHLSISGSKVLGQEPCSCPVGTNFMVENLFYNVPARRKFLKSNTTELNNILTAFERIVLVYPHIAFTFHSNGSELFNLRAGNIRQRIVEVFGKRLNQELLPVNVETTMCKVSGFVGKPEFSRKKGSRQYFFVNGRYMKHPYFHKAVMSAYERLVPVGNQVSYFLYFDVKPEDIDVNIHPTKTEIKFENEQAIWQILLAAIKEAVGINNGVSAIDFDTEGKPDIPVYRPDVHSAAVPQVNFNPQYNPFATSGEQATPTVPHNWEQLYEDVGNEPEAEQTELFESKALVGESSATATVAHTAVEGSPSHYQYKGQYIMTSVKSGLMLIDQHRAHVRILFEQYLDRLSGRAAQSQKVLFPEVVQLPVADEVVLQKILPEFTAMGFELTDLGSGSYAVNAVPTGLEGIDIVNLVTDMVTAAVEQGTAVQDDINRSLAESMARHAAIPVGQVLSNTEMEALVNSLFGCKDVNYTPSGEPILAIVQQAEIDRLFA